MEIWCWRDNQFSSAYWYSTPYRMADRIMRFKQALKSKQVRKKDDPDEDSGRTRPQKEGKQSSKSSPGSDKENTTKGKYGQRVCMNRGRYATTDIRRTTGGARREIYWRIYCRPLTDWKYKKGKAGFTSHKFIPLVVQRLYGKISL